MKRFLLALFLGIALAQPGFAQSEKRPARVGELEEKLTQDLSLYLRSRFPNKPFLVKVSVDPLRETKANSKTDEGLPFLESDEPEYVEPWENPKVSLHELQQRVRRTVVSVALPRSLNEAESQEIRDAIYNVLHLVPARDEVKIEQRDWKIEEPNWNLVYWVAGLIGAILFFALLGLYFIQWSQAKKLGKILAEAQLKGPQATGGGGGSASASQSGAPREPRSQLPLKAITPPGGFLGSKEKNQTIVTDPFRLRQHFAEMGKSIVEKGGIPSLEAMQILDDCGRKDGASTLASVLSVFPEEVSLELFQWSQGDAWLEAQSIAPEFSTDGQNVLETVYLNLSPSHRSREIEKIRIAAARLGPSLLAEFLGKTDADLGFALLSELPKGLAIETARKAYPGSWARTFEAMNLNEVAKSEDAQKKLIASLLKIKPLRSPDEITRYKKFREMIEYLDQATVEVEEEIYRALPKDSQLPEMRKPFFVLKELKDEELRRLVDDHDVKELALALCGWNEGIKRVRLLLSEKSSALFDEWIARFAEDLAQEKLGGALRVQRLAVQRSIANFISQIESETKVKSAA